MLFGVIACSAISVRIARRVGSAMALKISLLVSILFVRATMWLQIYVQLFGCANLFYFSLLNDAFTFQGSSRFKIGIGIVAGRWFGRYGRRACRFHWGRCDIFSTNRPAIGFTYISV